MCKIKKPSEYGQFIIDTVERIEGPCGKYYNYDVEQKRFEFILKKFEQINAKTDQIINTIDSRRD